MHNWASNKTYVSYLSHGHDVWGDVTADGVEVVRAEVRDGKVECAAANHEKVGDGQNLDAKSNKIG